MDSLMDLDLYELIGVTQTASTQEIKKAYRKKALSCHPDKNPNNPKATELFHELSRALEILTDASARAAYDKVINAKHQAALRVKEFDAKRKRLKEDLEAREDAYKKSLNLQHSNKSDKDKLRAEIERLQREGSKQVEEEIAFMTKKIQEQSKGLHRESEIENDSYKIKIKWKSDKNNFNNDIYDYSTLHRILSKYGDVATLVISPTKEGRALVEYRRRSEAEMALNTEVGLAQHPLKLQKLWNTSTQSNFTNERSAYNMHRNETLDADFERSVLDNLRRAEEKKRSLKEQTQN
ncbi:dnaJ homolog subfamily C member 17 isoform X2 [Calliopsis andreniformis]|uniref:dnaJ homolog subfamily C member 17 isoform X2 n=1 Tax=Calliopsis andreniformis TaxID=337506 RepID=UPI003FCC45F4